MPTQSVSDDAIVRKSSQEIEIDHLLAEEFSCDTGFPQRFVSKSGINCCGLTVFAAIPEPSLGGAGFGDLLIEGQTVDGSRVVLLIEDKITASPALRQAKRYADHAAFLRTQGWDHVWTILVAPASYRGERGAYDAHIDLETVAEMIDSPDRARASYRRNIILRAISKKSSTGVRIADLRVHELKSKYLAFADHCFTAKGEYLSFPALRERYYDGDSWIDPIRSDSLPRNVRLRHRLWTSFKESSGSVDLIVSPITQLERVHLSETAPDQSVVASFSKGRGVQISLRVSEMRAAEGFDPAIAKQAFEAMRTLMTWYRKTLA